MFLGRFDESEGLVVWLFTPGPNSDDDWQRYCDAIRHCSRVTAKRPSPCALQVIEQGSEDPSAKWRWHIAEATKGVMPHTRVVLVTRSPMVRHFLTAIQWLHRARFQLELVPSEEAAFAALERARRGSGPRTRAMLKDLRQDAVSVASSTTLPVATAAPASSRGSAFGSGAFRTTSRVG